MRVAAVFLRALAPLLVGLIFVFFAPNAQADCPHNGRTDHPHCTGGTGGTPSAMAAFTVIVEPDNFPEGHVLNDAVPGITLSNQDGPAPIIISSNGINQFAGRNIATTGSRVFGRVQEPPPQAGGDKLWDEGGATTLGALRIDFDRPVVSVSIDLICTDNDFVYLRVFNASETEMAEVLPPGECDGLGRSGLPLFFRLTLNPDFDIAFALAGAQAGDGVYLDNLQVTCQFGVGELGGCAIGP